MEEVLKMREPSVDEINAIVDGYRKNCPYGKGQTKVEFIKNGKTFCTCTMIGTGRDLDYTAETLAKKYRCKIKIKRKVTYM